MAQVTTTVAAMRLLQLLGYPALESSAEADHHAAHCMSLYVQWLPLIMSGQATDLGTGEDVVSLAVDALVCAHSHDGDVKWLLAVRLSPSAPCNHLGVCKPCLPRQAAVWLR